VKRTPAGRLVALLGAMVLALVGVIARLVVLQVGDHRALAAQGLQQRVHPTDLPAERGAIVDRTGVPLAITLEARDIYTDPRYVTDPIGEAAKIARVLGMRARDVERRLQTPDSTFVYLGRQIDVHIADRALTPRTLAAVHFVSPRLLHRTFAERGHTVAGWIRTRRLDAVARDLADPALLHRSIRAVAESRGFIDAPHFNRLFRQVHGCTPGEYRATLTAPR